MALLTSFFEDNQGNNGGMRQAFKAILDQLSYRALKVGVHSVILTPKDITYNEADEIEAFEKLKISFLEMDTLYTKWRKKQQDSRDFDQGAE